MMKLVFNHLMFQHINESAIKERGRASRSMLLAEKLLRQQMVSWPLALVEHSIGFLLTLPVPIYSAGIYAIVTGMRGLPHFFGMYVRALYYRNKLGLMEPNVFID